MYLRLAYQATSILSVVTSSKEPSWNEKEHAYRIRTVGGLNATTIEKKADRVGGLALSLTEGIHQFLQGCGTLDLEEDFIVVVGNFDVEVLTD